jgi:hypothetical protein
VECENRLPQWRVSVGVARIDRSPGAQKYLRAAHMPLLARHVQRREQRIIRSANILAFSNQSSDILGAS